MLSCTEDNIDDSRFGPADDDSAPPMTVRDGAADRNPPLQLIHPWRRRVMRLFLIQMLFLIVTGANAASAQDSDTAAEATTPSADDAGQASSSETSDEQPPPKPRTPLDEDGHLVNFGRDIAPILRAHCLECHGPEDAKNDFRVDDAETLLDYVVGEDWEGSTLYTDYLATDDEEMLMPPVSHGGPLAPSELALFRVWIEEGANWPEGFELVSDAGASQAATEPPPAAPKELADRIWVAHGYLHPATIHFPIALFMLGAMFVVFGWKWPSVGTQIPLACLLMGTLTAVAACTMGWAFAPEQGYGSSWDPLDWAREVDSHRWSAIISTALAVIVSILALLAVWRDSDSLRRYWKSGLLALALMVGLVGHQGGEMSYGHDFYPRMFRILWGTTDEQAAVDGEPEAAAGEAGSADGAAGSAAGEAGSADGESGQDGTAEAAPADAGETGESESEAR